MEKSEYEEFKEFKEFQRMKQEQNSKAIGKYACESQKKPKSYKRDDYDTLDYGSEVKYEYDRQGNYEGKSW